MAVMDNEPIVTKRRLSYFLGKIKQLIAAKDNITVGEEKLIGEWVEGAETYDLYRKTVNFGALPNAGQKTLAHGITGVYKIVRLYGMANGATNNLPLPFAAISSNSNIYIAVGKSNITVQTGTDRSAYYAYITIEFLRQKS